MFWVFLTACGQAGADEVASVMVTDGTAFVVQDGVETPARIGLLLDRDDTVRTSADGAIVLQLVNDHVVRIDAELELAVSDLVMLSAPPSPVEPGKQLTALLYPAERERLGSIVSDAERVAGWHARLTAAYAPSGIADEDVGGPGGAADELKAKESTREEASTRGSNALPSGDAESQPVVASEALPSPPPPPQPSGPPPKPPKPPKDARPRDRKLAPADAPPPKPVDPVEVLAARFAASGDLHECLTDWAETLPVRPESLEVRLVVRSGTVERAVVTSGGLRLPRCALDELEGEDLGLTETRVMLLPL